MHWLWPSLAALAVAAAGSAVAIAAVRDGAGAVKTIVALTPLSPASPPAPPRAGGPRRGLVSWPGADGYTIVLASLPVGAGIVTAKALAERAANAGLPQTGVLASTGYASLHPGYLVVFAGVYGSAEEAQAHMPEAVSRFRSAYVQQIAR